MKKLAILLAAIIITGCTCIGQIPDQVVYVGEDCTAPLPDYLPLVTVTDNCEGVTVEQSPAPGTLLSSTMPIITVTITATDAFSNVTDVSFDVVAVDTVPPVISFDSLDFSASMEFKHNLLDIYYNSVMSDMEYAKEYGPDSIFISEQEGSIANPWKTINTTEPLSGLVTIQNSDYMFGTFIPVGTHLCFCDSTDFYANAGTILSY